MDPEIFTSTMTERFNRWGASVDRNGDVIDCSFVAY
jgi:hypothetical protein